MSVENADMEIDFFPPEDFLTGACPDWEPDPESSHGYKIGITCIKYEESFAVNVIAYPCEGCEGYNLMIDFSIDVLDGKCKMIKNCFREFELVDSSYGKENGSYVLILTPSELGLCERIRLRVKVEEMLVGKKDDFSNEGPYRDFALLAQDKAIYVNVTYLKDLGGPLFESWYNARQRGVKRTVILNHSPDELIEFLGALCSYRKPIITSKNFDTFITMASEWKISKALRLCEQHLIQSRSIHPIRKLEYAAEHGLGLLADTVLRKFGSNLLAIESLHDYCAKNNENVGLMHLDVLEILQIYDDCIIL